MGFLRPNENTEKKNHKASISRGQPPSFFSANKMKKNTKIRQRKFNKSQKLSELKTNT